METMIRAGSNFDFLVTMLNSAEPVTSEIAGRVRHEVQTDEENRGYAGKTTGEIWTLLHSRYNKASTEDPLTDRRDITIGEIQSILIPAKTPLGADVLDTIKEVEAGTYQGLAMLGDEAKAQVMEAAKLFGRIYSSQMTCLDLEDEQGQKVKAALSAFEALQILSSDHVQRLTKTGNSNYSDIVQCDPRIWTVADHLVLMPNTLEAILSGQL